MTLQKWNIKMPDSNFHSFLCDCFECRYGKFAPVSLEEKFNYYFIGNGRVSERHCTLAEAKRVLSMLNDDLGYNVILTVKVEN
jgi:hypothetical protein